MRRVRAVVQRVTHAEVRVEGDIVGRIGPGLCVLLGAGSGDTETDAEYVIDKILHLRVFDDATGPSGKMNHSLLDRQGGLLLVPQFTLYGDVRKGRRPSFMDALEPVRAEALYAHAIARARLSGVVELAVGRFRAQMAVELTNDGPVTLLVDSRRLF